jgi:FtsP/CotA-like multicopper oxidase with cupredoxin domain
MISRLRNTFVIFGLGAFLATISAWAETPVDVCTRPPLGGVVTGPADLRSSAGVLQVELSLRTFVDVYGAKDYCYLDQAMQQAPTLRLHPGDELVLKLKNEIVPEPSPGGAMPMHVHSSNQPACGGGQMTAFTTNLHFHGMSIPPTCHQDETLRTVVQPSDPAFEYRIKIPAEQRPGLYWYHPHPHGYTEQQVLGGASGALIVEGIERESPQVAGLPERVLVLRDQKVPGKTEADEDSGPGKDVSLNFVPVMYPLYRPAELRVRPAEREFWRVLNASADTYYDLQIRFGATIQEIQDPQPMEVIAVDGVAAGLSGDAASLEHTSVKHILVAPGARAEFIAMTPPAGTFAQFVTLRYDTGPDGAASPFRVIANVRASEDAPAAPSRMPASSTHQKASAPSALKPVRQRTLYFSEERPDLKDPSVSPRYFITVEGETPKAFDMNFSKPDITVRQGTVEDWVIENRAQEAHAFHIHQLHFQVIERDGKAVSEPFWRDTVDLPYWDGKSTSYPRVKLRMDFRGQNIVGTFVFHCHILEHEDAGMMGSIEVLPAAVAPRQRGKGPGRLSGAAAGTVLK